MRMPFRVLCVLTVLNILLLTAAGIVQAPTQVELAYDDGTTNSYQSMYVGRQCAVKFSLPTGWISAKILMARYYLDPLELAQFEVNIYDSDGTTELFTPFSVNPTAGYWFDVDLSSLNVVVDDDFYIVIEWTTDLKPYIGQDYSAPIDMRSYWRTGASESWNLFTNCDNMIRAVVEEQVEPPPGVPEFPLGWTIEILLIPVVIYMLWKTKRASNVSSLH